jgi:hypothetical protein
MSKISKKNNITKDEVETKIISLIESECEEITTKDELETYKLGSLISYLTSSNVFKLGGLITIFKEEYFIYDKLNSSTRYRVRYCNIIKMWVGDFVKLKHKLTRLVNSASQTSHSKIDIDKIEIVYNGKLVDVKQSVGINKYNSIIMNPKYNLLVSRTDFNNIILWRKELVVFDKRKKQRKDVCSYCYEILMNNILNPCLFKYQTTTINSLAGLVINKPTKPSVYIKTKGLNTFLSGYHEAFTNYRTAIEQYKYNGRQYNKLISRLSTIFNNIVANVDDVYNRQRLSECCGNLFTKSKRSFYSKRPSTGENMVIDFLDKMCHSYREHYQFYYFYSYRWLFCCDKQPLECDFYCFMISMDQMDRNVQFVIEFDGEQHFEATGMNCFEYTHVHDIMKQHYLYEMNIHLLRINNGHNMETSIVSFINRILTSKTYVSVNEIQPIMKYFTNTDKHAGLIKFNKYHHKMHKALKDDSIIGDLINDPFFCNLYSVPKTKRKEIVLLDVSEINSSKSDDSDEFDFSQLNFVETDIDLNEFNLKNVQIRNYNNYKSNRNMSALMELLDLIHEHNQSILSSSPVNKPVNNNYRNWKVIEL